MQMGYVTSEAWRSQRSDWSKLRTCPFFPIELAAGVFLGILWVGFIGVGTVDWLLGICSWNWEWALSTEPYPRLHIWSRKESSATAEQVREDDENEEWQERGTRLSTQSRFESGFVPSWICLFSLFFSFVIIQKSRDGKNVEHGCDSVAREWREVGVETEV